MNAKNTNNFIFNKSAIMGATWKRFRKEAEKTDNLFYSILKDTWKIAKYNSINYSYIDIYKKYQKSLLNYINLKVKDYQLAEDLTSDTFIKVLNNLCIFDSSKSNINTWIHTIANNNIIDYHRKHKTISISNFTDEKTGKEIIQIENPKQNHTKVERDELKESIYKAFNTLKPTYRKIAELYFIKDLPYNQIATKCQLPMGTVKCTINKVRKLLQNQLQKERTEYLIN